MRMALLAACAFFLANCTTPNMTAMNTNGGQQRVTDEEPPVPAAFRKPPPQSLRNWGGNAYGGRY